MEKITLLLTAILGIFLALFLYLLVFGHTLGAATVPVEGLCQGYCAVKVKAPFGSIAPIPNPWLGVLPGGFCGC